MKKRYKIGRYYYEEIPKNKITGEPILLKDWEDESIFTLIDYDGEPIKFFRRLNK